MERSAGSPEAAGHRAAARPIRAVAVDLTPILPGGDNGGAKLFVLELLRRLPLLAPDTRFILLTQAASHDELAPLDRPNVERRMVLGAAASNPTPTLRGRIANRLATRLPYRAQRLLSIVRLRLQARRQRRTRPDGLGENDIDLLFCPFTAPTYASPGIATVCTLYDLQYKSYPYFFGALDLTHRDETFRQACRHADAIAPISDYSRDDAIRYGDLDPSRLKTIYLRMARRADSSAEIADATLARLGLQARRYLLYPANFWRHKNHEMLLTAFGIARARGLPGDIRLVCTGAPGARQQYLAQAASALGLGDAVVFPGFLPDAQLHALMASSAAVVYPSLFEGFGLPLLEAMAAEVPVACSRTTSLPEVAAGAALLFDPRIPTEIADAMVTLTGDSARCAELVAAGRVRARDFSDSDRMAREYWDLFQAAASANERPTMLSGVHADGWVGPQLRLHVAAAADPRTLELRFEAPGWLPHPKVRLTAVIAGGSGDHRASVARGRTVDWSLPIAAAGGSVRIDLSPAFTPAELVGGEDRRVLSAVLSRCDLVGPDGARETLHPAAER